MYANGQDMLLNPSSLVSPATASRACALCRVMIWQGVLVPREILELKIWLKEGILGLPPPSFVGTFIFSIPFVVDVFVVGTI